MNWVHFHGCLRMRTVEVSKKDGKDIKIIFYRKHTKLNVFNTYLHTVVRMDQ